MGTIHSEGIYNGLCVSVGAPEPWLLERHRKDCVGALSLRDGSLQFCCEEALYLLLTATTSQRLLIRREPDDNGGEVSSVTYWYGVFLELHPQFWRKFTTYMWGRCQGWVVRGGLRFGADWLYYPGSPEDFHASYAVIFDDGSSNLKLVAEASRLAKNVKKKLLVLSRLTNDAALKSQLDSNDQTAWMGLFRALVVDHWNGTDH